MGETNPEDTAGVEEIQENNVSNNGIHSQKYFLKDTVKTLSTGLLSFYHMRSRGEYLLKTFY